MTTETIIVENIKCAGCMTSIKDGLMKLSGVRTVEINKDEEKVTIIGENYKREEVIAKLSSMGYPESGHNDLMHKAKSYVSCAIGKMSN